MSGPRNFLPPLPPLPPLPGQNGQDRQEDNNKYPNPGCIIADETNYVMAHLYGLSEGWGGFGLLRLSKTKLEKAAEVAEYIGAEDTSGKLLEAAERLVLIDSTDDVLEYIEWFKPLAHRAWEFGRRCSGLKKMTKEQIKEALEQALDNG